MLFLKTKWLKRRMHLKTITEGFNRHGATILDTSMFELVETLTGKYEIDSTSFYDLGGACSGVEGMEAEAVLLGQPVSMVFSGVVGFKFHETLLNAVITIWLIFTVTKLGKILVSRRFVYKPDDNLTIFHKLVGIGNKHIDVETKDVYTCMVLEDPRWSKVKDTFKMFQNVGFKVRMVVVGDNIKAAKAMAVKFGPLKSNEDTTERPAYHLLERPPVGHGESHFGALSIAAIIQNKGFLICTFWSKDAVCISKPKDKIIMSLLDFKMQKAGRVISILTNAAEMTYQVDCKLNYNYASKIFTPGYVGNESIAAAVLEKNYMETDVGWSSIWIRTSKTLDLEDKVIFEAVRMLQMIYSTT
uniref:Uncharacterized protein n=1 Tax=Kalanchoe fedtschenkoi TaxID=63787 RepID=A0A7N0T6F5_KALFE